MGKKEESGEKKEKRSVGGRGRIELVRSKISEEDR